MTALVGGTKDTKTKQNQRRSVHIFWRFVTGAPCEHSHNIKRSICSLRRGWLKCCEDGGSCSGGGAAGVVNVGFKTASVGSSNKGGCGARWLCGRWDTRSSGPHRADRCRGRTWRSCSSAGPDTPDTWSAGRNGGKTSAHVFLFILKQNANIRLTTVYSRSHRPAVQTGSCFCAVRFW